MPLTSATRLGSYEIIAPLGAGGMGEVYRAKDLRLGREIALKVLPKEMSADAERLARFEREARTVAGLNHPNIVMLHTVEDAGGVRFLTMELVEGQSLDHALTPGGMPVTRVIELGIALADALAAAHEKGVVHRDLKPANVMLTKDGRVKVLDFGVAKLAAPDVAVTQAATVTTPISGAGTIVGTVPYMAPEQIRGEAVDARADLFALGIVLYELTSGTRPFAGDNYVEVGHAILHDAPRPVGALRTDVPRDLERIIGECLEKSPRERVQTALDVSNSLRRLRKELDRSASGVLPRPASDKVASIAVLPFVNRSASADDEYFSDGLADELLNVLSKIKGLRVVARSSSYTFKGKPLTAAHIGRALDVATLLEGSVRKAGNRMRISVQLVNVADSSHLWSETYDRTLDDIFAVQDDIAHSVVKELRTTLLGEEPGSDASGKAKAEVGQAAKGRGSDAEAHRLNMLARHLIGRGTRDDTTKAIGYLKEALARDATFSLGWTGLAWAYAREADRGWTPVVEGYTRAKEAVERALALEPDLAEAHARKGWIQCYYDWDFRSAKASYARALELAPGNADLLRGAGVLALTQGQIEQAIALTRRALDQDPLSVAAYSNLALQLQAAHRLAEAEATFRKGLELSGQQGGTRANLSLNLLAQGRSEEARAEAMREPEEIYRLWALAIIDHHEGRGAESDAALRKLIERYAEDGAYQVAAVYGARGEADPAFEWLERAFVQRDTGLIETMVNPLFQSLHADPRWSALLKKMRLGE